MAGMWGTSDHQWVSVRACQAWPFGMEVVLFGFLHDFAAAVFGRRIEVIAGV